jgi:hypothetical protein
MQLSSVICTSLIRKFHHRWVVSGGAGLNWAVPVDAKISGLLLPGGGGIGGGGSGSGGGGGVPTASLMVKTTLNLDSDDPTWECEFTAKPGHGDISAFVDKTSVELVCCKFEGPVEWPERLLLDADTSPPSEPRALIQFDPSSPSTRSGSIKNLQKALIWKTKLMVPVASEKLEHLEFRWVLPLRPHPSNSRHTLNTFQVGRQRPPFCSFSKFELLSCVHRAANRRYGRQPFLVH